MNNGRRKGNLVELVCLGAVAIGFLIIGVIILLSARRFGSNFPTSAIFFILSGVFSWALWGKLKSK